MNELKNFIEAKFSELERLINQQGKRVLNTEEAAQFLGISEDRIRRMCAAGVIPYSKPSGKRLYFKREDLEAWALGKVHVTHATLQQRADLIARKLRQ